MMPWLRVLVYKWMLKFDTALLLGIENLSSQDFLGFPDHLSICVDVVKMSLMGIQQFEVEFAG